MKINKALAAELESDERAIRIAEALALKLGSIVEVFDAEGNKFWVASPPTPGAQT